MTPLGGKGKKEAETVVFKDNQVSFVSYGKKGFPSTNFTLSVQDDGMVVWETMQTSEKAGHHVLERRDAGYAEHERDLQLSSGR